MNVTTISNFRRETKKYFDQVIDDQDVLLVTRSDGQTVAVMPLERYSSTAETEYILSSPINAARVRRSFKDAMNGNVIKHKLATE